MIDDNWSKLKVFVSKMSEGSYDEVVWVTCNEILDKMEKLESEDEE